MYNVVIYEEIDASTVNSNPSSSGLVTELYHTHHSWIYRWLCSKLSSQHDAADLTQDTFVTVLEKQIPADIKEPRAYLTSIAHGLMVNFYRRQSVEQAYTQALSQLEEAIQPCEEQRLVLLEALQQIDEMLTTLPDKVRRAFLLSQLDGLRYKDIAIKLDVTERTVKRYMAEAFTQCLMLG